MNIVEFKNVTFIDENKETVFKDLSFIIKEKEFVVLTGSGNSGKTLILKIISGLVKINSGEVTVLGQNITNLSEKKLFKVRKEIGLLFQNNALFNSMTNLENVIFPLDNKNYSDNKKLGSELLKNMELDVDNLFPDEISGGMQKRVSLARAIIHNPKLALLDDPTAGLDPITSIHIYNLIKNKLKDKTVIFTTQNLDFILKYSDRVLMLKEGKLIYNSSVLNIKNSSKEVKEFIGKF